MNARLLPLLLSLSMALAGPAAAQCTGPNLIEDLPAEERAALEAAIATAPYPEGNLWRAEKPGSTVYVQGTIHIPDPRLDPVAARAGELLAGADLLILEATTEQQAAMQRQMAENPEIAFLTEGPTLIDLLGDETWAEIADELTARGIPPFYAAKFRPWLLAMTLAIPQCAMTAMTQGELGLDARLEAVARQRDIPIATLDDTEALLELMSSGTLEEQLDVLRMSLLTGQDQEAAMATTLDSYFAGRHRELWEFSHLLAERAGLDEGAMDAFEANLLDGRNEDWAEKLPELIEGKNVLVAVGAAHLAGDTGILMALERMGYEIDRL